jgi:hypothetical protein
MLEQSGSPKLDAQCLRKGVREVFLVEGLQEKETERVCVCMWCGKVTSRKRGKEEGGTKHGTMKRFPPCDGCTDPP